MVELEDLVQEACQVCLQEEQGRDIVWKVGTLPQVHGDRSLLRLALVNLISNALKFTRKCERAEIEIASA